MRKVILGRNADGEASFEWSVRKLIDCRNLGFGDLTQAINCLGSHDVGGEGNERFFNYLGFNGVAFKDKQIKLAFVCLLTAVGIPNALQQNIGARAAHVARLVSDADVSHVGARLATYRFP